MTASVGIIAHTASGKDIRRLVAQAATISDQAKVSIVAQALVGLGAVGVMQALVMPDQQQLGKRAGHLSQRGATPSLPKVEVLSLPVTGKAADTTNAAREMRARGAGSIIVLGGDGTARAASRGAGETPLLCISTGTNNVLPYFVEGTVAGIAAGAVALGLVSLGEAAYRSKRLEITVDGEPRDVALVDVALLSERFIGSRAVWQSASIRELWVTRAEAHNVGLTSIATTQGLIGPRDPWGCWVTPGETSAEGALAVLAPGLVERVRVARSQRLWRDRPTAVTVTEPSVLTLDGEREHALRTGARLEVTLRLDGPWLIEPQAAMHAWAQIGLQQLNDRSIG